MTKKVLLINRGSDTDNLGDQAINYVIKEMLEGNSATVHCVNYTLFYNRKGGKFISIVNNLKKGISIARKNYDIVIIGGGQLILNNKSFPVSFFLWSWIFKVFSNSKIFLFGVGVVGKYSSFKKKLIKMGLFNIESIYVRDELSKKNLENIFNVFSRVIPDPVFGVSELFKPPIKKSKDLLYGITTYNSIKRYGYIKASEIEYLKTQSNHILDLSKSHAVNLIYNTKEDYIYAKKLQNLLQERFNFEIEILEANTLEDYIHMITSAKIVVSSRMHALIIALSYGLEIVPIVRNEKLLNFKNEYKNISIKDVYHSNNNEIKKILNDH